MNQALANSLNEEGAIILIGRNRSGLQFMASGRAVYGIQDDQSRFSLPFLQVVLITPSKT